MLRREKANPVANYQEIPRESTLAKVREPPREQKVDEGKDHLVSGKRIKVVVHQCTKSLLPTKITIIMRRWGPKMPPIKKGTWAKKVCENSGRTRTVLGKPYIRSTRELIRSRGAKVLWPPHTQSGLFLNVQL